MTQSRRWKSRTCIDCGKSTQRPTLAPRCASCALVNQRTNKAERARERRRSTSPADRAWYRRQKAATTKLYWRRKADPVAWAAVRARHNERRRKERADPVKRAIEWEYQRQRSRAKRREVWAAANRLCAICDENPVPFGPGGRLFCRECKAARWPGEYWCGVCGGPRPPRRRLCDTCRALRKRSQRADFVLA